MSYLNNGTIYIPHSQLTKLLFRVVLVLATVAVAMHLVKIIGLRAPGKMGALMGKISRAKRNGSTLAVWKDRIRRVAEYELIIAVIRSVLHSKTLAHAYSLISWTCVFVSAIWGHLYYFSSNPFIQKYSSYICICIFGSQAYCQIIEYII